jgi:S-DNA-T family DNA segregation ATPase FtsK/SpoIIIE
MNRITNLKKKLKIIQGLHSSPMPTLNQVIEKIEYRFPSINLLNDYNDGASSKRIEPIDLETKIAEFGIESCVNDIRRGPVITRYELKLARGTRISQVRNISDDLAMALMSDRVRIQAPIPGTNLVGIEIANEKQAIIGLKKVLQDFGGAKGSDARLPIALGTDTVGNPKVIDLATMPHLLIAGQTGSGKSVFINNVILSILYTHRPEECQLILVDPKRVEMTSYEGIPHLRYPVVTEPEDALEVFSSLIIEMENRYKILSEAAARNIESYNKQGSDEMPYIVCVVDEMADLMMTSGKALEKMIVRLAQLARAVGIHLVLATQKPVVKVITGLIKSNMPSRISFQVASKMDSRVILDCNGAEGLIGRGDMLMSTSSSDPERYHGAWISDEEIHAITNFIKGE